MKISNQAKHLASDTMAQNGLLAFLLGCYSLSDRVKFEGRMKQELEMGLVIRLEG